MNQRRERLYRTEAVVLRRSDLGEADRLLTCYTPTKGKIRVIAKGARKIASRKAGHIELFIHSTLLIAKGKSLDIVTQAETLHAFRALRRNLDRITYAHYAVELLDRFTAEGEENKALFELLIETLQQLSDTENLPLTVRFYELRLLALEGYQPQLFRCQGCGDIIQPTINYFDPEQGGVLCPRCGEGLIGRSQATRHVRPVSVNALKVLRYIQTHNYETCMRLRLKPQTQLDIEALMLHYITYILERNLKSVDFMHRIQRKE